MISSQAGGSGAGGAGGYGRRNTSYYSHSHRKSTLVSTTPTKRINSVATIGVDDANRIDLTSFRNSTMTVGGTTLLGGTSGAGMTNMTARGGGGENNGFFRNIFSKNCRAYLTTIILNAMKNLNNSEGKCCLLFDLMHALLFCSFLNNLVYVHSI